MTGGRLTSVIGGRRMHSAARQLAARQVG